MSKAEINMDTKETLRQWNQRSEMETNTQILTDIGIKRNSSDSL